MSVFQYLKSPHLAYGICVQSKNHRIMKAYLPTIWYDMLAYPRPSHSPPKPSTVQLPVITASLLLLKKVLNFELFSFLFLEVTFSKEAWRPIMKSQRKVCASCQSRNCEIRQFNRDWNKPASSTYCGLCLSGSIAVPRSILLKLQ